MILLGTFLSLLAFLSFLSMFRWCCSFAESDILARNLTALWWVMLNAAACLQQPGERGVREGLNRLDFVTAGMLHFHLVSVLLLKKSSKVPRAQ